MKYQARWFQVADGAVVEQLLDAPSIEAAEQQLRQRGVIVLALQTEEPTAAAGRGLLSVLERLRAPRFDAAWWCTEVRVLLAAGMTVVEAIETMIAQSTSAAPRKINEGLYDGLQQGSSLSAAMAGLGAFPAVLLAGVTAGERSGALIDALDEYLRFHGVIDKIRRQFVSAAIYPLMVLAIGAVIGLFLLLYVMPRFAAIYADMPQPASALTAAVLGLSRFLSTQTHLVVLALVSLAAVGTWWWRSGRLASFALAISEATPAIRARTDEFRRTKLFQALALMIRGGYTLDDAMARCTQLGLGRRMSIAIESARHQVLAGVSPAAAFSAAQLLDEVSLRLMRVGERSGHFDRVLTTIAERHAQRFGTTVERVTRMAEPLMLLLVALAVGTLVVLMYIPVFDIAGSVR